MIAKGTAYLVGKNGRLYVASHDQAEGGEDCGFVQLRWLGEWLYRAYGPARTLNLGKAVLLVGRRFEEAPKPEGYQNWWREVQS